MRRLFEQRRQFETQLDLRDAGVPPKMVTKAGRNIILHKYSLLYLLIKQQIWLGLHNLWFYAIAVRSYGVANISLSYVTKYFQVALAASG